MRALLPALLLILLPLPALTDQDPAKPDPAAKQDEAQETEKPPARQTPFNLELGWETWGLDGNETKFRQYATPPKGLFLREFRYSPFPTTRAYGLMSLKGIGETDYRGDGSLSFDNGRSLIEAEFSRNRFFDPTVLLIDSSQRDVEEIYLKQYIAPGIALSGRYRSDNQHELYDPPKLPLHQRSRYSDLLLSGKLGPGQLRMGIVDWRYFDRTELLFDTKVTRYQLGYLWEIMRTAAVEAAVAKVRVRSPGADNRDVNVFSLVGDWSPSPRTDVILGYHRDTSDRGPTVNAFVREMRSASARLVHRWNRWTGQLAVSGREAERVRGDQTFVDTPNWITFEGRVSGRIQPNLRLTLRGYTQTLNDEPVMTGTDSRSLLFDARRFAQLRLDGGRPDLNGYFTFTHRTLENDVRNVDVNANLFTVGGNWEATPALSVFAEFTRENWGGSTEIVEFPTFSSFAPDSDMFTLGANYMFDASTFLSANFTNFRSKNENPLQERDGNFKGTFFTLSARRKLTSTNEIGLVIAPWVYRDRIQGTMDYDARVIMVTGNARF